MASHDLTAVVDHCAQELRQVGDKLYWRYKLLEILIKNYKAVSTIK
ncbi:phorbol-12-myristate-13-acetate-induced protein 1 [Trachinotus anak]